jgi:recombination protein RecR
MKFPLSIQNLINSFAKLPTVGVKTAERYVFYLLKQNPEFLQKFAQELAELKEKTTICQVCGSIAEKNPCLICADPKRNKSIICVVSGTREMLTLESSRQYNGLYHILNGTINVAQDIKPEHLNIKNLIARIKKENIEEIILALNPDLEGETTSLYLIKIIKPYKIKISRLARGLPMGSDLEYADEITLTNALKHRTKL